MNNLARISFVGCLLSLSAGAQTYTVSAKPGAVNYVEGDVFLNGTPLGPKTLRESFLNPRDSLRTEKGRAEILLTPGVFLRIGENSEVRMISPSLTDTQVELIGGEMMVEATGLVKDNHLQIIDRGSTTVIGKNGLYRFEAGDPPLVAVLEGRARVNVEDTPVDLKKGHEVVIADNAKSEKFDKKKTQDDLYAWSSVRSEYDAAASYRVAQSANAGSLGYSGLGLGPGLYGSGWFWDSGFSSWAWLPGAGAYYSPFGYGLYSPALIPYAPVVVVAGNGGRRGTWDNGGDHRKHPIGPAQNSGSHVAAAPVAPGRTMAGPVVVPVRPSNNGFRGTAIGPSHPSFSNPGFGAAGSRAPNSGFNSAPRMGGGGGSPHMSPGSGIGASHASGGRSK